MHADSRVDVARSDDPPRVTVLVMTYNHANFIAQALDSALAQRTGFALSRYFFEWAQEYAQRGDRAHARKCFRTSLQGRPINRYISGRQLLKVFSRLYLGIPRSAA